MPRVAAQQQQQHLGKPNILAATRLRSFLAHLLGKVYRNPSFTDDYSALRLLQLISRGCRIVALGWTATYIGIYIICRLLPLLLGDLTPRGASRSRARGSEFLSRSARVFGFVSLWHVMMMMGGERWMCGRERICLESVFYSGGCCNEEVVCENKWAYEVSFLVI